MKKEIAELWADELESGRHQQCVGTLVDFSGAVCAFGALGIVWARETGNEFNVETVFTPTGGVTQVWSDVCEWAGIRHSVIDGEFITELNDEYLWELKRFADPIREQWETL